MKQTEAAKKIISLWPEWPHAVGENLSDDALRFVGWLRLRHPDVLDFRSGEAKLGLIVGWLSADRAITESYRRGELLQEHLSAPAQPCAVNVFQMRAPLRKTSNGSAAARTPTTGASSKYAKAKSPDIKSKKKTSGRKAKATSPRANAKTNTKKNASGDKAKAGAPRAKAKAKAPAKKAKSPAKKPRVNTKRAKSQARSGAAKSPKSKAASKPKKSTSASKSATRRPRD